VQSGAYRDDGPELDASLDKLQAAIDAAKAPANADTRDDRAGEDDEPFQSDFGVLNH
jgi:hypothetical protein